MNVVIFKPVLRGGRGVGPARKPESQKTGNGKPEDQKTGKQKTRKPESWKAENQKTEAIFGFNSFHSGNMIVEF